MYDGDYLDYMHKITVGEVWRLQRQNPDGFAWIYDDFQHDRNGGDPWDYRVAVFRIERITDGRGRYWQTDGKLTIEDTEFGTQDFPLVWRRSNLNRSGFWVLVGVNCYGRTLYRTRHGWELAVHIRQNDGHGALYDEQRKSRQRRRGRGTVGGLEFMFERARIADDFDNEAKNRKFTYRGKPTPWLRRTVKRFRKYGLPVPQSVMDLFG